MHIYVYIYMYIYICIRICMHVCIDKYIYIHNAYTKTRTHTNIFTRTWTRSSRTRSVRALDSFKLCSLAWLRFIYPIHHKHDLFVCMIFMCVLPMISACDAAY